MNWELDGGMATLAAAKSAVKAGFRTTPLTRWTSFPFPDS